MFCSIFLHEDAVTDINNKNNNNDNDEDNN